MSKAESNFSRFILLWTGELISAVGSGLTSFGLGVWVFQTTGKASATALVTLLAFAPALLMSAPAGVLADRYDRRALMILGDSLSAVGLLYILVCMNGGGAQLWQICVGVTVSSVFSALMDPAYKATITDLLTPEEYTKASGLVGIAGSAKYLISPVLAGFLLSISDIRLLILIDICTFFVTVTATFVVRSGLSAKKTDRSEAFISAFCDGWKAVSQKKGVLILVILSSGITFFMGFIQTLFTPMLLAFTDSKTLGVIETVCASGMLVSGVALGVLSIRRGHVKILSAALFLAGVFMAVFGLREDLRLICVSGFLFFATLPFANTALDFLIRTNIVNDFQGRAWGLIGVISQLGYVLAYAVAGVLADGLGKGLNTTSGRGAGYLIAAAGMLLAVSALILYRIRAIRQLEKEGEVCC